MIKGIDVILYERVETELNDFGEKEYDYVQHTISNVLVSPTVSDDLVTDLDLEGKKEVYTLAIPKGDNHTWEDSDVEFFGKRYHVFSPVQQTIDHLTPLSWNKKVLVERYG